MPKEQNHIETIARGVILHEDNILMCKPKNEDYFYFPGGHVEFEEDVATALKREIKEEVNANVARMEFIGVLENQFFGGAGEPHQSHEINIVFCATLQSPDIQNMENHIESRWISLEEFKEARVLPISLKEQVLKWLQTKQVFFASEKDNKQLI